jgi:hypothetical protein
LAACEQHQAATSLGNPVGLRLYDPVHHGILQCLQSPQEGRERTDIRTQRLETGDILEEDEIRKVPFDEAAQIVKKWRPFIVLVSATPLAGKGLARSASTKQQKRVRFSPTVAPKGRLQIIARDRSDVRLNEIGFGEVEPECSCGISINVYAKGNLHARFPQSGARTSATAEEVRHDDSSPLSAIRGKLISRRSLSQDRRRRHAATFAYMTILALD